MPLSPADRAQLKSQLQAQIGSYDGYSFVWFGGEGFNAPTRIYNWFRSLPAKIQLRMLQMIGERQTEVISGTTHGEEPYEFGAGVNRNLYMSQLQSATIENMTSVRAVYMTASHTFHYSKAMSWERDVFPTPVGLWNYAKTSRFYTNAGSDNANFQNLHNWLYDLLPELYCDYVNEVEPKEEPIVRQITTQPLVYYVSWGDIQKQPTNFVEILFYPTATPNAIDNLRPRFASYTALQRSNKLLQLFGVSNHKKETKYFKAQDGTITFRYDVNQHLWVRQTEGLAETIIYRYDAQNHLEQSVANSILT